MIISNLQHRARIEQLHPLFKAFFDYVTTHDLLHEELGRYEVLGDTLFINNVNPQCVEQSAQVLEAHCEYIDIHLLLEGKERIGWKAIEDTTNCTKPYSAEEDCALYDEPASSYIDLLPGQFAIVYPEDAHAPVIGEGKIRKLIGKIRVQ